jgi:glycyl-tRNA synthetase beta chain
MTELFIELRTEEIPARFQTRGAEDFIRLLTEAFKAEGITHGPVEFCVSPRHLAVAFSEMSQQREDRIEERRGPRADAPAAAIEGFLSSAQLTLEQCEQRQTPKGVFLFAHIKIPGAPIAKLLPAIIEKAILSIPWPTSMRWGWGSKSWIRPIRSGVCLLGGKTVPFTMSFGEHEQAPVVTFGNTTVGHRFLGPSPFSVNSYKDFKEKLERSCVIVDQRKRQEVISKQAHKLVASRGLTLVEDQDLLDEVTGLVEWPVALMGEINPIFMSLPPQVLMTSMRVHQRYFSLQDQQGQLAPYFITISNMQTNDKGKQVIIGNERVLNARLSDAKFFYDQDVKVPLLQMAEGLSRLTFHAELGTMAEKTSRLQALAGCLAQALGVDEVKAKQAASLLKADLLSKMVGEFPELQGIMGAAYARAQGYEAEVADAIAQHYSPKQAQDNCPPSLLGQVCALADRIDTLVGFFAIGIRPTGSKDPFALRRAALGLIRLLESQHALALKEAFAFAYIQYEPIFKRLNKQALELGELLQALEEFVLDRLKVSWREQALRHDVIAATFAEGIRTPLYILKKRAQALQKFLERSDQAGDDLLKAYRRASNIVHIEEAKDQQSYEGAPEPNLLQEEAEKALVQAFMRDTPALNRALAAQDFEQVMNILAALRPVIDTYFNDVIVNSPDAVLRFNRLKTLSLIRTTLQQVADFSQIVEG